MQPKWRMRYYPAVGPAIPHESVGRSRVTHPFAGHSELPPSAHDLHVLSTPPAFVLSQDQTLQESYNSRRDSSISSTNHKTCQSNSPRHPDRIPDRRVRLARPRSRLQLSNSANCTAEPSGLENSCRFLRQPRNIVVYSEQVKGTELNNFIQQRRAA